VAAGRGRAQADQRDDALQTPGYDHRRVVVQQLEAAEQVQ